MGMFDALTTAVTGLQAQSFALQNISGNIANSQTDRLQRKRHQFEDSYPGHAQGREAAGGVLQALSPPTPFKAPSQTTRPDRYGRRRQRLFRCPNAKRDRWARAQFSGAWIAIRVAATSSRIQNGYLVNGAGYYLMGVPVNPATGAASSSNPSVLQFSNNFIPAQATSEINYQANLPSTPTSGVLNTADYTVNPLVAGSGTVVGNDATTFSSQSLDGGSITAYELCSGNPVNVQMRWAETSASPTGNTWELFYQTNTSATGTQVAWQNAGTPFTFNSSGQLTSPASPALTLSNLAVNGDTVGNVTLDFGTNLTQYANTTGAVQVNGLTQNGFAAGSVAIALGVEPRAGCRRILQRPNRPAREHHACDLRRPGRAAAAQRRGLRGHAGIRHGAVLGDGQGRRQFAGILRTSISRPSSAS